jgi:hypothetical protein
MSRIRPSKGLDDFILSGSLRTGDAYVYTAPPETPASRDKLIQPFCRQNTECVPWFASFCATQNDFSGQWVAGEIGLQGASRWTQIRDGGF